MTFGTENIYDAAFWLSQKEYRIDFTGLNSADRFANRFKFTFKIDANEVQFNQLKLDYMNRKTTVEPKNYMDSWNLLKDNLTIAKGN